MISGGKHRDCSQGGGRQYHSLDSFKLGVIRLSNLCLPHNREGPVTPNRYKTVQQYAKNEMIHAVRKIRKQKPEYAIGSSGICINLAEIAEKILPPGGSIPENTLSYRDLKKVIALLCSLPLEQRRKVPGINPERADIIIAGAAIPDTFLKELSLDAIRVTTRGLQDRLSADYLSRFEDFPLTGELSPRERSVMQLGRSCGINEMHEMTITGLALDLFDSAQELKLHAYGNLERELLEYTTFLHDIGSFISFNNHHAHSYYMIRNSELPGFDQKEIIIMANLTRFHRKKSPGRKNAGNP